MAKADASPILFRNMSLLDPRWDEARGGYEVLVDGALIKEVSNRPIKAQAAQVVDCGKRTLMPGLIDCHVHVCSSTMGSRYLEDVPLTLMTAHASIRLRSMLDRGFTTVRDTAGADWGLKLAVESGLLTGPRLFISGRGLGPTGGHSDPRRRTRGDAHEGCHCCEAMSFVMEHVDGVDAMRKAAREQLRQGVDGVKIMCSGGVASPYDPLDSLQLSFGEISAAVEEATAFGRYVLAHAYTPEAISRAVTAGVRTIEHGNLIDVPAARLLAKSKGYMVANLIAYSAMKERAASLGMSRESLAKNDLVLEAGLESLDICKREGVSVGYGSDLLGALLEEQSREFLLRAEVLSPIEIIRQATVIGAEIVHQVGKLGVVAPGAFADLILVDGNPLKNLRLFQDQGAHLPVIMKAGRFHKNGLGA